MIKNTLLATIIILTACAPARVLETEVDINTSKNRDKAVISGSSNVQYRSETGKYHLEAKDNLTVNIHETNRWILPAVGAYIFGRPIGLWLINKLLAILRRRKRNGR